jgi:hypothetical protein
MPATPGGKERDCVQHTLVTDRSNLHPAKFSNGMRLNHLLHCIKPLCFATSAQQCWTLLLVLLSGVYRLVSTAEQCNALLWRRISVVQYQRTVYIATGRNHCHSCAAAVLNLVAGTT